MIDVHSMKFSILATISVLCLSNACENHGHHSHSHQHDEDLTTSSAHRRLGQLYNAGDNGGFLIDETQWPNKKAFEESGARCGQPNPTSEEETESDEKLAKWIEERGGNNRQLLNSHTINTYAHVICNDSGNGCAAQDMIDAQMSVLNAAYASSGFSFNLQEQTQTSNSQWYRLEAFSQNEIKMKAALRQGGSADLNIYLIKSEKSGILGWAFYPFWYALNPKMDGVVISKNYMPGGNGAPYNLGHTAVHEVGHWLGLYHTFQGGCNKVGDSVGDTPAEQSPTSGCPKGRDSCPGYPGLDPIHNYMDYSDDSCTDHFTKKQIERMHAMWSNYRDVDTKNIAGVKFIVGQSKIRDSGGWDARVTFTLFANEANANLSGATVEATIGGASTSCRVSNGGNECTTDWVSMKRSPSPATIKVIDLVFKTGALVVYDSAGSMTTAFVSKE